MDDLIERSPEVAEAQAAGRPVVALESTIITHGMPYPQNLETARAVEAAVREAGATPATIAVMGGRLQGRADGRRAGALAQARGVAKLSRADLAALPRLGRDRGDHGRRDHDRRPSRGHLRFRHGRHRRGASRRGGELRHLRRSARTAETPVTVVAAGAKAILDLPKTLEVLETLGVPVIAVGQDAFPAFWSRDSGLSAPLRLDTAEEIAAAHRMRAALGLPGGQLVANPIPAEAEIPAEDLAPLIAEANAQAVARA
jgi:pseudouridine-5'-phosphate glycosidase